MVVRSSDMDSRHFVHEELKSHDGADVPVELLPNLRNLMEMLDVIRDEWAGPITVVSGYRSPELNRALVEASIKRNGGVSGVATDSQHIHARAADIRPAQPTPERVARLYEMVKAMYAQGKLPALGGLGKYERWSHVDCRDHEPGVLARWTDTGMGQST